MKNHLEKKNAEYRIKQLLAERKEIISQNTELQNQLAYMRRVVMQMMSLLPKLAVNRILEVAKKAA